jgi:hypothetical protein
MRTFISRCGATTACILGLAAASAAGAQAAAAPAAATPAAWAGKVCTSLNTWQNAVERTNATTAPSQKVLLAEVAGLITKTKTMTKTLASAGVPAVPQGAAIQQALQDAAAAFAKALAADQLKAKKLPVKGGKGAAALLAAIAKQGRAVGVRFITLGTQFNSSEFNDAEEQTPICGLVHG